MSADCKLRPRPPALVLRRKIKYSDSGSLNVFSNIPRSSALVVPEMWTRWKERRIRLWSVRGKKKKKEDSYHKHLNSHHPDADTWSCGKQSSPPWLSWVRSSDRRAVLCGLLLSALGEFDPAPQTFLMPGTGQDYPGNKEISGRFLYPVWVCVCVCVHACNSFKDTLGLFRQKIPDVQRRIPAQTTQNVSCHFMKEKRDSKEQKASPFSVVPLFAGTCKDGCRSSSVAWWCSSKSLCLLYPGTHKTFSLWHVIGQYYYWNLTLCPEKNQRYKRALVLVFMASPSYLSLNHQ